MTRKFQVAALSLAAIFLAALAFAGAVLAADPRSGDEELEGPYRSRLAAKQYRMKLGRAGFTPDQLVVHSIGQSHIDAAWKWRKAQTRTKVYRTFKQAVEHIKRHPDFNFSGSSPQYYEWVEREHPDLFAEIVELERAGRWEIVGGMWVEPDGNMPSGEAFVRQRLLGQLYYKEKFGHISEVSWLLDSFGYNWNYPQIVSRSGAKYMWTSKLTWNDTTIFPFHNFFWRSPDGSEVLTHICPISPIPAYFPWGEVNKYKGTRYMLKPETKLVANYATLPATIEEALSDDWLNVVGVFYGLGDGGLGPVEAEVEIQEALAHKGYTRFSTGMGLFADIEKCANRLPVWNDEMYLEFHRGVLTTQGWIKEANRRAEQLMYTTEVLRSVNHAFGIKYPYEELKELWKLVLFQQFHDILPGSSIPEVYDDAREDYEHIFTHTEEVKDAGLVELAKTIELKPPGDGMEPVVVFNSLGWDRSGIVSIEIPTGKDYDMYDSGGTRVASQEIEIGDVPYLLFRAEDVASMGYKTYFIKEVDKASDVAGAPTVIDSDTVMIVENEHVQVVIDKDQGWVRSLFDKNTGKQLVKDYANRVRAYYDRPDTYSAWNISRDYLDNEYELPAAGSVTVTARGPLFSEVSVHRVFEKYGRRTTFEQRIRLVKGDPVVYLDLDSDFNMHDALVKVEFNTVLHSDTVAAENAYLAVGRPAHPQTDAEKARWEMPCQKWIDFSDSETGLALLNKDRYGFSLNEDGTGYRMTVFKGARYPRANPGAKDVKHQYWTFPAPTGYTDQGPQSSRMGLLAHSGDWRNAELWKAGHEFNTPMEGVWVEEEFYPGSLPSEGSFISLSSGSSYIGAVKRAEGGDEIVVRLVEAAGKSDSATINFGSGIKVSSASVTDLLEMNEESASAGGSSVSVSLGPYEIKTVKIDARKPKD